MAAATSTRPSPHGVTVWFTGVPSAGNIRRIGYVAGLLTGHGVTVLVSAISPYRVVRGEVRAAVERVGGFAEVHVATDLATCRARDVKGLDARQSRGELQGLTGVDDPYEPPLAPELVLDTAVEPPEASAARVLALLEPGRTGIPPARAGASPAGERAAPPTAGGRAAPPTAGGRAAPPTAAGRAPSREGSRPPEAGRTAVHSPRPRSPDPYSPRPHGGRLTERLVPADRAEDLAAEAARLPTVALDGRALADLECLAVGAFSPLTGFLGAADHTAVVEHGRLADGTVWTLPVALPVPAEVLGGGPDRLALTDPAHPGVAATLARRGPLVGGPVHVLGLPPTPAELGPRLTPAGVRAETAARGWRSMAGFQTRNPVHRAHEYLPKVALEHLDGLLLHPQVGQTKDDDVPAALRMACYRALQDAFYCRRCEAMATSRTCPHPAETRVQLSGTAVRDPLARGQLPPPQFSRPEVARLLADGYRARGG